VERFLKRDFRVGNEIFVGFWEIPVAGPGDEQRDKKRERREQKRKWYMSCTFDGYSLRASQSLLPPIAT
jgi:hypothetical protein